MHAALKNLTKLTLAASFLLLVAWSVILFNGTPAAPVKEAQADIAMLSFAPKSKQQRFVEGIKELGMEDPRSYDWNGNKVFFSMMHTKDSPQEVMRKAHRVFKQNGLNKESNPAIPPNVYSIVEAYGKTGKLPKSPEAVRADIDQNISFYNDFFTGGLVPVIDGPDHILMAGGTGHGKDIKDVYSYIDAQHGNGKNMIEQIKSMHVLEATRQPGASTSLVTAVWSDDDLDMRRFMNKGEGVAASTDIPACPGCDRIMSLQAESPQELGYVTNSFVASNATSEAAVVQFYDRSLGSRGWRRMDSSVMLHRLQQRRDIPLQPPGDVIAYSKDDKFISLDISRNSTATLIQIIQSP